MTHRQCPETRATRDDRESTFRIYQQYLPLIVFEQQPGVAIRKKILQLRGLLRCGQVRHPGGKCDQAADELLQDLLCRTFPGQDLSRPLTISHRVRLEA